MVIAYGEHSRAVEERLQAIETKLDAILALIKTPPNPI
jgi:hypothetical protein